MKTIAQIRDKIQKKVFDSANLSRSIEIQQYQEQEDSYGEMVLSFVSQDIVDSVVLDYKEFQNKYDLIGKYNDSNFILLLPYNTVIDDNSIIIFDSKEYIVNNIEKPQYGTSNVVIRVFTKLKQDLIVD